MALPRRLIKALKAGQYQPSAASKKAREAAANLRERQPPPTRDIFVSVRDRMIRAKHRAYYGVSQYNPQESNRAVRNSDEFEAMERAMALSSDDMRRLASMAGKAHAALAQTGSAGQLEVYLQYDFLFYHL